MADERKIIEEAYAGDIIGVFDPGIFSIGDTLELSNKKFAFEGIPTFAPEHFAKVRQIDTPVEKRTYRHSGISEYCTYPLCFQTFNNRICSNHVIPLLYLYSIIFRCLF